MVRGGGNRRYCHRGNGCEFAFAGLAETFILLALNLWGGEPALGLAGFLTTVTDVIGFFVFELAAWILL